MLEDAARLRLLRGVEARMHAFGSNDDQFARLDLALVDGADQVEGAGFGGEDDGVGAMRRLSGNAAHHQRTEAARIARGKDAVGRQHDQRKCAFQAAQRIGHGVGQRLLARTRDQVHDDFGVAGGLEDRALAAPVRRGSPAALVMLPLCASAILPLLHSTMMGCALSSAESPVVE